MNLGNVLGESEPILILWDFINMLQDLSFIERLVFAIVLISLWVLVAVNTEPPDGNPM